MIANTLKVIQMHEVRIVYKRPLLNKMPKISSSSDAANVLKNAVELDRLDLKEFFWVLLLNNSNNVLGLSKIAEGHTTGVTVNLREIIQLGILSNSVALIVAHNHPSGKLKPSEADIQLTEKINKTSNLFDLKLLDHIILTSESYFSFSDNGIL